MPERSWTLRDGGSRDTVNGTLVDETFIPLDWARGLVRVGVQSAIAHPEAEKLLVKLMEEGHPRSASAQVVDLPDQGDQRLPVTPLPINTP